MNREEATTRIENHIAVHKYLERGTVYIIEALNMAIKALEKEQWIPCSERLPEDSDYRSCMECMDGAVWYCTENGTVGLGYYYKSTKEWEDELYSIEDMLTWEVENGDG